MNTFQSYAGRGLNRPGHDAPDQKAMAHHALKTRFAEGRTDVEFRAGRKPGGKPEGLAPRGCVASSLAREKPISERFARGFVDSYIPNVHQNERFHTRRFLRFDVLEI